MRLLIVTATGSNVIAPRVSRTLWVAWYSSRRSVAKRVRSDARHTTSPWLPAMSGRTAFHLLLGTSRSEGIVEQVDERVNNLLFSLAADLIHVAREQRACAFQGEQERILQMQQELANVQDVCGGSPGLVV